MSLVRLSRICHRQGGLAHDHIAPRAVIAVLFTTYLICYLDRLVMASAVPFIAKDLHFSATQSGAVMSAFFAGYALMQIPGGILADRYGPR